MPFTEAEFFDNFRAYNAALWPAVAIAWLATAALFVQLIRRRPAAAAMRVLTIAQWGWVGVVFHAGFFTAINPAAWLFAAMFMFQALMLGWNHLAGRPLNYGWTWDRRHVMAGVLMAYALGYPALSAMGGTWPAVPLFLVPCPLVIFDTGLFLTSAGPVPRKLLFVPIAWALIGGSAAVFFGVLPDLMLFACAGVLLSLGRQHRISAHL